MSEAKDLIINAKEKDMYYVYILTNKSNNVLYIGVTHNLAKRVYEHKNKFVKGLLVNIM